MVPEYLEDCHTRLGRGPYLPSGMSLSENVDAAQTVTAAWVDAIGPEQCRNAVAQIWALQEICRSSAEIYTSEHSLPRITKIIRFENPARPTLPTFRIFFSLCRSCGSVHMVSFLDFCDSVVVGSREDAHTDVAVKGSKTFFVYLQKGRDDTERHFLEMDAVLALWSFPEQFPSLERTQKKFVQAKGPPKFFRNHASRTGLLLTMSQNVKFHPLADRQNEFLGTLPGSVVSRTSPAMGCVNETPILARPLAKRTCSILKTLMENPLFAKGAGSRMKPYKISSKWNSTALVFGINLEDAAYVGFCNLPAEGEDKAPTLPAKSKPVPFPEPALTPSSVGITTPFYNEKQDAFHAYKQPVSAFRPPSFAPSSSPEELAPSKLNLETTFGGITTSERRKLNLLCSSGEFISKKKPDLTVPPSTNHACFVLPHDRFSGYLQWNDLVPYRHNLFGSQEEMRCMMNAYVGGRAGIW